MSNATTKNILKSLQTANLGFDDLSAVATELKNQTRIAELKLKSNFGIGTKVSFTDRNGKKIVGTVEKMGRGKNMGIVTKDHKKVVISPALLHVEAA